MESARGQSGGRQQQGDTWSPEITATRLHSATMRPARSGSLSRYSAIYLIAVAPSPMPAKTPNPPTVEATMPYSP